MRLKPIRHRVLVKLDPEDRTVGESHLFVAPDMDSILWCRKCGRQMEAIKESACVPEAEYGLDPRRDAYVYKGEDNGHHMESFEVPVVVERARRATVITSGSAEFDVGERVLIDFASGRSPDDEDPASPYRLVPADTILARLEEETAEGDHRG